MQTKSNEDMYENLLAAGFTKSKIDSTLYKFLLAEIEQRKTYKRLSIFLFVVMSPGKRPIELIHH